MKDNAKIAFRLDGEGVQNHCIPVEVIAPSLLNISNSIQHAAQIIYRNDAKVRVSINANIPQNCFEIEIVTTAINWAKVFASLLAYDPRNVLDQLMAALFDDGEISGLLKFWVAMGGEQIPATSITQNDNGTVNIAHKGVVMNIHQDTYNIYCNDRARKETAGWFHALKYQGIESMEFGKKGNATTISQEDVADLLVEDTIDETIEPEVNLTTRNLILDQVKLDADAKKWKFRMGGNSIVVDISDTDIAIKASERGVVGFGDRYRVRLEEREHMTKSGNMLMRYRIDEVLEFIPAQRDQSMFADDY